MNEVTSIAKPEQNWTEEATDAKGGSPRRANKKSPALANSTWYKGILVSQMAGTADNDGAFDLVISKVRRGTEPPPHLHSRGDEVADRGARVIGLSVDPVYSHKEWAQDIRDVSGHRVNYPIIADTDLRVSKLYEMLPADAGDSSDGRTAILNAPVRTVFVIGPDKRIKLMLAYLMTTARNFSEIIRVLDSMQLTAKHKVATPADWIQGDDVIISGALSDEEAKAGFLAIGQSNRTCVQQSSPSKHFSSRLRWGLVQDRRG